jgi:hypothetical protein
MLPKKYDSLTVKNYQSDALKIKNNWLKLTDSIADLVPQIPHAKRIASYLRNNVVAAWPNKDGGLDWMEGGVLISDSSRRLAILTKENRFEGSVWDSIYNSDIVAYYNSDRKTIYIREDKPISDFIKAITLLHEGNHAMKQDLTSSSDRGLEEKQTFEFQMSVMLAIGGNEYQTIINQEMDRLMDSLNARDNRKNKILTSWMSNTYPRILDRLFGQAKSDYDREIRRSCFWIQAAFNVIEKGEFTGDIEDNKTAFITYYYQ